jgi:6-phosphofructokinase 2
MRVGVDRLGLTKDMDLKEAVMFGIACGASTVMAPGNELCQKSDVERIFNQMKEGRISNKN